MKLPHIVVIPSVLILLYSVSTPSQERIAGVQQATHPVPAPNPLVEQWCRRFPRIS